MNVGCNEYRNLSRRQFVVGAGKIAVALGLSGFLPRVSLASSANSSRDTILSIYLRGGCDGLSLCVPFGDDAYYAARPTVAIARPDSTDPYRALSLDGFFGISNAMAPLMDAYTAGHLLFVHAAGLTGASRSHFESQRWTESGFVEQTPGSTGWLGRHLASSDPVRYASTLRAVALGDSIPHTLAGGPQTSAFEDAAHLGIQGISTLAASREAVLRSQYAMAPTAAARSGSLSILDTVDLLSTIDFANYVPAGGAQYPNSDFGYAMMSTAALIRADVGVEAIAIDYNGWDMHIAAGTHGGLQYGLLQDLAAGLAAFHADLVGAGRFGTTIATVMSEFGRTVAENLSGGTDHGTAGAMMVLGGGVAGGRVLANWPGLAAGQLFENQDLKITIDYRDILSEIVANRLGNAANLSTIFPSYTPNMRGVTLS